MADELNPLSMSELPTPRWDAIETEQGVLHYDKRADILTVSPRHPRPAISIEAEGLWVRLDPTTGAILGLEIEDFRTVFLVKHPELANSWQQLKSGRVDEKARQSWLETLIECVRRFLGGDSNHTQHLLHA